MFKQLRSAGFTNEGMLGRTLRRYWLQVGSRPVGYGSLGDARFAAAYDEDETVPLWSAENIDLIREQSDAEPILLIGDTVSQWWMYKNRFYVDDEDLTADAVAALVDQAALRSQQPVDRALTRTKASEARSQTRAPIPDDVKMFVWRRDEGRCVRCDSNEDLEFDHIIPVTMGGANTARNLQLLCEPCNRAKGGRLV